MNDDLEPAIQETRAWLAERAAPDLTGAVMRGIAGHEPAPVPPRPGLVARLMRYLWVPRPITVRPALALAGMAAVVVLAVVPYLGREESPGLATVAPAAPSVFVQFRLEAMASRVQLAGSFTNWEPRYELREAAPGIWSITVPLTQGVHDYAFVVDGQRWVADPYAPQIGDGFGGTNNRLALLTPDNPQL
jgi:hypothetical protein